MSFINNEEAFRQALIKIVEENHARALSQFKGPQSEWNKQDEYYKDLLRQLGVTQK